MLALYSVALVVGQAPVLMRNRASQSAVPALCLPANWGHMGAGPLVLKGLVLKRAGPGRDRPGPGPGPGPHLKVIGTEGSSPGKTGSNPVKPR